MSMKLTTKLCYDNNLVSERTELTSEIICENIEDIVSSWETMSTATQLEFLASYILFAPELKEQIKKEKQISLEGQKKTYRRKDNLSIEDLHTNPAFDENRLSEIKRSLYTKPKPQICRVKDADVPGLCELWEVIDALDHVLKVNTGKEVDEKVKKMSSLETYRLRHMLIELRREQYVIKDMFKPVICKNGSPIPPKPHYTFEADTGYVRGDNRAQHEYVAYKVSHQLCDVEALSSFNWEYVEVSENTFCLTNPLHIYALLSEYSYYKQSCWDDLNSELRTLIMTVEEIIDQMDWEKTRWHILMRKIDKVTNDEIVKELRELYGISYNVNYISTIWKNEICADISAHAQLMEDKWKYKDDESRWKICRECGEKLLKDNRFFVKKCNSKDGLASRCKKCDKKIRDAKKVK